MHEIRKITPDEIKEGAKMLAETFMEYPMMTVIFPNEKKRLKQSFYFFWYYIYTARRYTYVTDDIEMLATIIRPGDKEASALPLILNPKFSLGVLFHIPLIAVLPRVLEYLNHMGEMAKRHYNPDTDIYVEMLAVRKQARGKRYMVEAVHAFDDGSPIYCETLSEKNVKGYSLFRLKVVEERDWRGAKIYAMRRERKDSLKKKSELKGENLE